MLNENNNNIDIKIIYNEVERIFIYTDKRDNLF